MFRKISQADYHFNHAEFREVSAECIELIKLLLVHNPKKRITGQQALEHPWFARFRDVDLDGESIRETKINDEVLGRL